jgi:hypothetical protein
MRAGKFVSRSPCLAILPATAVGGAGADTFEAALRSRADEVWRCVAKPGVDVSQQGKVMTTRVVVDAQKPAQTSLVVSDLGPDQKRCLEGVVTGIQWPSAAGTGEVTLRMVVVSRVWVDDPHPCAGR